MDLRELVQANRDMHRESPTLKLFAADTIAAVLALMERHLDRGVKVAETELVTLLERDMPIVGLSSQTPAQLISSWGERGWLHRISDDVVPGARRVCWLSVEAQSKGTNAMTTAHNIDLPAGLAERLTTTHPNVLRELLATLIHTLIGAEARRGVRRRTRRTQR